MNESSKRCTHIDIKLDWLIDRWAEKSKKINKIKYWKNVKFTYLLSSDLQMMLGFYCLTHRLHTRPCIKARNHLGEQRFISQVMLYTRIAETIKL